MPGHHTSIMGRIAVTSPARTLVDIAAGASPARLETLAVEATRVSLVTLDELYERAGEMAAQRRPGARAILRLVDGWDRHGATPESVLESRLASLLRRGGLPPPKSQYRVLRGGRVVARLDFAYPREMVAIEADGYRWHGDVTRWRSDLARRNELTRLGWTVLHFTWHDVTKRRENLLATVRAALRLRSQNPEKRD